MPFSATAVLLGQHAIQRCITPDDNMPGGAEHMQPDKSVDKILPSQMNAQRCIGQCRHQRRLRDVWDRRTVVVVDEAAMLDSRVTVELLAEAKSAGAKVILAGDDRQLASIERGGLFTELRKAHGAAEITEVTRQKVDWQRQAARGLAEGRFDAAVQAFDRHGAVTWTADGEAARAALVTRWKADTAAEPQASRFVFAYTNAEVDRLNAELRGYGATGASWAAQMWCWPPSMGGGVRGR